MLLSQRPEWRRVIPPALIPPENPQVHQDTVWLLLGEPLGITETGLGVGLGLRLGLGLGL